MNKRFIFGLMLAGIFLLSACKSKQMQLLCKKWDCVKAENAKIDKKSIRSSEDSLAAATIETALKSLSWNFNGNNEYQCSVGDKTTVTGTFHLEDNGKLLVCTPASKNNINTYQIKTLTENELVLSSRVNSAELTMQFRPH